MFQCLRTFQAYGRALTCARLQMWGWEGVHGERWWQRQRSDWGGRGWKGREGFSALLVLQSRKTGSVFVVPECLGRLERPPRELEAGGFPRPGMWLVVRETFGVNRGWSVEHREAG